MAIAKKILAHLESKGIVYECLRHAHTATSQETAEASHVPGDQLAKGVVLEREDGARVLAVLPATRVVRYSDIEKHCGSRVRPAPEELLGELFSDCEIGAVPPFGTLYGVSTLVDKALVGEDPIYFEAGDHESVVRLSSADFRRLSEGAEFLDFSTRTHQAEG